MPSAPRTLALLAALAAPTGARGDDPGQAVEHAPAQAAPEPPAAQEPRRAEPIPDRTPPAPDPVRALADAARRWQPTRTDSGPLLDGLARWSTSACAEMRSPIPDAASCPALLIALAFRESSWRPEAIGRRGELGLMQVHGLALGGMDRARALQPENNVKLGARWLDVAAQRCRASGWAMRRNFAERALSAYAGLGCSTSSGARLLLTWTRRLHRLSIERPS